MNIYSLRSVLAKVNEYQVNAIMWHFYSPQIYAWSLVASLLQGGLVADLLIGISCTTEKTEKVCRYSYFE